MSKPLDFWVQQLNIESLPILRRSRQVLTDLARDIDTITPDQIAAQVYHDPFLVSNLLRRVTKVPRRGLSGEVTTVDHAVMMLGMTPFFNWTKSLPVLEDVMRAHPPHLLSASRAMSRIYHAAYQSWEWAAQRKDINADEVFAETLLSNCLAWAGWLKLPEEMQQVERLMRRQQLDFAAAFAKHSDYSLDDVQTALAKAWKLPEFFTEFSHGRNTVRAEGVKLALLLSEAAEYGWWQPRVMELIEEVSGWLHLPVEQVTARIYQNAIHAARHSVGWYPGATPVAALLPMLPGEWPPEPDDEVKSRVTTTATPTVSERVVKAAPVQSPEQAVVKSSAVTKPQPPQNVVAQKTAVQSVAPAVTAASEKTVAETNEHKSDHVLHPEVVARIIADLKAHMDGSYDISQLMTRVLTAMHDGLAFDRVVFALMGADKVLKARFTRGVDQGAPLSRLNFSAQDRHLFGQMMTKMQAVWFHDATQSKLTPYILPMLRAQLGKGEFMAMSIHVLDKPVGFFYADYGDEGHMDSNVYTGFKQLCQITAEGMGHLSKKPKS